MIVLGSHFDGTDYEIEDTYSGDKTTVKLDEIVNTLNNF